MMAPVMSLNANSQARSVERKIKVKLPEPHIEKLGKIAEKEGRSREMQARAILIPVIEKTNV